MIQLQEGRKALITQRGDYAVVAITKHGVEIARNLGRTFQQSDVYYMSKFEKGDEQEQNIQLFSGSVRMLLPSDFTSAASCLVQASTTCT